MKPKLLSQGYSKYGALMGRTARHVLDRACPLRFRLYRIDIDPQGYDGGGAYWGLGMPLYRALSASETVDFFFRAHSRSAAKETVRAEYPNARFYR